MESGKTAEKTVYVRVPSKINAQQTGELTTRILNELGCKGCTSGYRLQFIDEGQIMDGVQLTEGI